jgi:hypothetical protein
LLADLADRTGLRERFGDALAGSRVRRSGHDPGRVLTDLAVMLADGGRCISDLAVLRDQPALFGAVASTATAWRVLDGVDGRVLSPVRSVRALARERLWAQRAETAGPLRGPRSGGRIWPGMRIMLDATLVDRAQREGVRGADVQGRFRLPPAHGVAGQHRRGVGCGVAAGQRRREHRRRPHRRHRPALAQIPDADWYGLPILVCADGAGCSRAWLAHRRSLRRDGVQVEFSVGSTMTETVQAAILALPEPAWTPAIEADGSLRRGADVAKLTAMLPDLPAAGWPEGMRVIVRRERPHLGAQLRFTDSDGWRFHAFATDTGVGQLAHLEVRHRAHARVEDRIRCAKDTGLGHLPSREFAINAVWVELPDHAP